MNPYFSVVIPTYNRWPLLYDALQSVLEQTHQDLEILVVDDGSTDDTKTQITRLHGPIRLLTCNRGGPARARNIGIREARGRFIAFLDSDDLWYPDHLAEALEIINHYPKVDFLFADTRFSGPAGIRSSYLQGKAIESVPFEASGSWRIFNRLIYQELVEASTVTTSTVIVRRTVLQQLGGFDERLTPFGEDSDMWLRICATSRAAANWSVRVERRKLDDGLMLSGQEFLWRTKHLELFRRHAIAWGRSHRGVIHKRLADLHQERAILSLHKQAYGTAFADLCHVARYNPTGFLGRWRHMTKRARNRLRRRVN